MKNLAIYFYGVLKNTMNEVSFQYGSMLRSYVVSVLYVIHAITPPIMNR